MTVGRVSPRLRAASEVPAPPAQASTIAARSARPAETVLDRIHVVRVERSSSLTVSAADGMRRSSHLCQRTNDARDQLGPTVT